MTTTPRLFFLLAALALGVSCEYQRPRGDDDDDDDAPGSLVNGLDIDSITFNQGVEITLMENGEEVDGDSHSQALGFVRLQPRFEFLGEFAVVKCCADFACST